MQVLAAAMSRSSWSTSAVCCRVRKVTAPVLQVVVTAPSLWQYLSSKVFVHCSSCRQNEKQYLSVRMPAFVALEVSGDGITCIMICLQPEVMCQQCCCCCMLLLQ
jgi:hypothetical protein